MPIELTMTVHRDDNTSFRVHYYYDRGQKQWFDDTRGVGGPGYDAFVRIYEVDVGKGWENPALYPDIDLTNLEDRVLEHVMSIEETMYANDS